MRIAHTMIRVRNLEKSVQFYTNVLNMQIIKRKEYPEGKFTLVFLGYGDEKSTATVELTYNWETSHYDIGNGFGHIALEVNDIYVLCDNIAAKGGKVVRAPGPMKHGTTVIAFVEDPDGYKIELIERKANLFEQPAAKTAMLIRKPVTEVFEAFINPEMTSKFWFTHSTGKLEVGKQITWEWRMYNVNISVNVIEIETNKKIIVEWGNYNRMTTVEWTFETLNDNATYVSIVNRGFQGNIDEIMAQVSDSTKGFTFLLSGAKAFLEHGIQLNLTADAFPSGK